MDAGPAGPSVFSLRPRSEWVAHNDLAFAIRDAFPVSPGHTLVVLMREVPSWFDTTPAERAAILDLINVVREQLDADLRPDGYNVGFNVGAAAGQTVPHLHVHVIPRFRGDTPDPTGGVRHALPGKGNYLAPVASPLSTGGPADPFLSHIRPLFARADRIDVVAAFVQDSGLLLLHDEVLRAAAARSAEPTPRAPGVRGAERPRRMPLPAGAASGS